MKIKLKKYRFESIKWFTFVIEAPDRQTAKRIYKQFKK